MYWQLPCIAIKCSVEKMHFCLCIRVFSVTPGPGSQSLFTVFAISLHLLVLDSTALPLFSLPFPTALWVFLFFRFLLGTIW